MLNELKSWLKKPAGFSAPAGFEQVLGAVSEPLGSPSASSTAPTSSTHPASSTLVAVAVNLLALALFLLPVCYLPILVNWSDLPKQTLAVIAGSGALLLLFTSVLRSSRLHLTRTIFDLPVLLLLGLTAAATVNSLNRPQSLTAEPLTFLGAALLYFALTQVITSQKMLEKMIKALLWSSTVLAGFFLLSFLWAGVNFAVKSAPALPAWLNLNPSGSLLAQALFTLAILPPALGLYWKNRRPGLLIPLFVSIAGLAAAVTVLFQNRPVILPWEVSWRVATGALGQSLSAAIFGLGPGSFLDAFTLYKGTVLNNTALWNLRFAGASNICFHLLTVAGIGGLAAYIFLLLRSLLLAKKRFDLPEMPLLEKGLFGGVLAAHALLLLLPAPYLSLFTLFILIALLAAYFRLAENSAVAWIQPINLPAGALFRLLPTIAAGIAALFLVLQLARLIVADYYFARSFLAAAINNGIQTYNLQIQALGLNPTNDSYRAAYAQTNLALADALASQQNLTDQQKQAVIQLVQQAIREGRLTVSLAPRRAAYWESLAGIYRSLIGFASGAEQWAVAALNQAIALEPASPRLRLDLGGVYLSLKDYQSAAQIFSQAVNLKPDLANAHYNLAFALQNLSLTDQAIQELQLAASLVCFDGQSADCQKVKNELAALGQATPSAQVAGTATPSGQLEPASPLATSSGQNPNLPRARTVPPARISTPSGEIQPPQP